MSPISDRIESLAELHRIDVLWVQEFWLERASIREYDGAQTRTAAERGALEDVERWLEERGSTHGSTPSGGGQ